MQPMTRKIVDTISKYTFEYQSMICNKSEAKFLKNDKSFGKDYGF